MHTVRRQRVINLIHFSHREALGRREVIRKTDVRLILFRLLLELPACDHHRNRGMGD